MTTVTAVAAPAPPVTRTDTRTVRRYAAAALLPLGPLSVAILRGMLPYFHASDSRQTIEQTAGHLGRQDAVLWLSLAAAFALVPSALAAARLAQRHAPVLSLLGVGLLVPGYLALPFAVQDPAIRALAGGAVDHQTAATLLDQLNGLAPVAIAGVIFILGHIVGTVLLGAALWRAHAVPAWAAVAVIVSQPLHLVAFVILGNQPLDVCAWSLTALGLGVAAARVLRTPNDSWDLPPAAR